MNQNIVDGLRISEATRELCAIYNHIQNVGDMLNEWSEKYEGGLIDADEMLDDISKAVLDMIAENTRASFLETREEL